MLSGLKVCHVLNSLGGTTIPADIGHAQLEYTDVSKVCFCSWFVGEEIQKKEGIVTESIDAPKGSLGGVSRRAFTKLREIIRHYDIVHTHSNHAGFYGKLAAKLEGIPVISTEHNDHDGFPRKGRVANGITNPLCDAVTCVSDDVFDSFERWERIILDEEKVSTVYNGVDFERLKASADVDWDLHDYADIDDDALIVANAATSTKQKNQETLIRAVKIANQRSETPIELVISGDGPRYDFLEDVIDQESIKERVHLMGYLEKREYVYQMIRASDVFAMPSRWEGFCVAVLEAMALRTATVLSDIDVFREVYGSNARYHEVENESELADQLVYFAEHPEQCAEYGENGHKHSKSFKLERTSREYRSVYKDIL